MEGKIVQIISSPELIQLRLKSLIGYKGVVVAKGENSGFWVQLDKPFLDEEEWFIPSESLQIIGQS